MLLAGKAVWRRDRPEGGAHAWSTIDSSLFWGALAGLTGLFHTAMGLLMTALSVMRSAPVEPAAHGLIAGGIAAAVAASAYGLLVFLLTALVWFGFRQWELKTGLRGS